MSIGMYSSHDSFVEQGDISRVVPDTDKGIERHYRRNDIGVAIASIGPLRQFKTLLYMSYIARCSLRPSTGTGCWEERSDEWSNISLMRERKSSTAKGFARARSL